MRNISSTKVSVKYQDNYYKKREDQSKDENGNYIIEPLPLAEVSGERNRLIVQDEAERAAAQEVINNTPQAVIDSVNS